MDTYVPPNSPEKQADPSEAPWEPQPERFDSIEEIEKVVREISAREENAAKALKVPHAPLDAVQMDVLKRISFNLVGIHETKKQGIEDVHSLEKSLVVDPLEIAAEAERFRQVKNEKSDIDLESLDADAFSFLRKGKHVNLAAKTKLNRVWNEGYILRADLRSDDGKEKELIGYMYGLDHIPHTAPYGSKAKKDKKFGLHKYFPNLDARDIGVSDTVNDEKEKEKAETERMRMLINWRTSVREDMRRLGIASVLKLIMLYAEQEYKTRFTLNTGMVKLPHRVVEMPNWASMNYNGQFMQTWAFRRTCLTDIRDANKEKVAQMLWLAHHAYVREAIQKLLTPQGPILGKGWGQERIVHEALRIREQKEWLIKKGKRRPDPAHALGKVEENE